MVTNLILPNDRLPINIERGAEGGPGFLTIVQSQRSGNEVRIPLWSRSRGEWDISYGIQLKEDFDAVKDLFYNAQGRAAAFLFKDWSDFEIGDPNDAVNNNQPIIAGDGSTSTRQIFKRYTVPSGATHDRNLHRIINGSLTVLVNGVVQTETTHYTVDYSTGVITFVSPPGNGLAIEIACEFDILVRFDSDRLPIAMETFEAGEIPPITIVEIKE